MKDLKIRFWILDELNHTIETDPFTWGKWSRRLENRRVAYSEINSEMHVSTVFIGIDHRHYGDGPPILFETMVFENGEGTDTYRYASWDDAKTGHDALVRRLRREKC